MDLIPCPKMYTIVIGQYKMNNTYSSVRNLTLEINRFLIILQYNLYLSNISSFEQKIKYVYWSVTRTVLFPLIMRYKII